jgi:hypothetical protein
MPDGHDYSKKYGGHKYVEEGTSSCGYGCGCWVGVARSGGPIGVDPFGECPHNPEDKVRIGGTADQEIVVTRRIRALELKVARAEAESKRLRRIKYTPKAKLIEEIEKLKEENTNGKALIKNIEQLILSSK